MINSQNNSWQQQLSQSFKSILTLCDYLELNYTNTCPRSITQDFPIRVPKSFAQRIEKGNWNDPLLKQILPTDDENKQVSGFTYDPVGDLKAMNETGLIHKYHGRALLINTGNCAIHCRYCFRRNFPYTNSQLSTQKQKNAFLYLAEHTEIHEVILSGGDPLSLSDNKLAEIIKALDKIPHLKRIRIHSRLPIVLPDRITDNFIHVLTQSSKQIIMVVHCNHANELDLAVKKCCEKIRQANISILNQSVLLKGINDDVLTLKKLSEKLFGFGIMPYYLHLLDKAQGVAHFDVPKATAIVLMQDLQAQLSGYLVPKLVHEEAGAKAKTIVSI